MEPGRDPQTQALKPVEPLGCFFLHPAAECGPSADFVSAQACLCAFPLPRNQRGPGSRIWQPSASLYHNSACFSPNKRHLPLSRHLCFDSLSLNKGLPTCFPAIPGVRVCTCVRPSVVVASLPPAAFRRCTRGSPEPQVLGRGGKKRSQIQKVNRK